ncbi:hypothetical protein HS088_TW18G00551 [Tripterygium wilfordii]|uniref:Uncharacterized protein n=1 Tax=Tripterygium wilfordii TaxID=458696 RepID=A0A7J7CDR1_TRIWF|nr:hypothetical protein HS088_TW18G00551 [Tripterygium wilfordii]
MRRSFTGNPFSKPSINTNVRGLNPNTPANTPSDTPRRNSMNQENIVISFREVEDKENGQDPYQKVEKIRSPAATKDTKNFMSPTISAASKFNSSPKKKILVERNEPAQTSFSLSDANNHLMEAADQQPERVPIQKEIEASFVSTITDEKFKEAMKCETFTDIKIPLVYKNELESSMEAVTGEADLVNVDPSFKISPRPSCACLAPLDADPRMPPYDPKNNYLSPRPQFLHYKPNPRIKLFLKGKEAKQLEESFAPESSSDTEVTEETVSENSKKEPENISSNDSIKEEEENMEDDEEPDKTGLESIGTTNMRKGVVETKGVSKPCFFSRSKFVASLLFMVVAYFVFLAIDSPVKHRSMFKELRFSKMHAPPEIAEIAKANLDRLDHNLRLWSSNSYISELILTLRDMHREGPSQFSNFTGLIKDHLLDFYQLFDWLAHNLRLWSANFYISETILTLRGMHIESPSQFSNLTCLIEDHLLDWYQLFDHKGLEIEKKNEPIQVKPKIENAAENLMLEEEYEDLDYDDDDYELQADQGKNIQDTIEIEDSDHEDEEGCKEISLDNILAKHIEPKFEVVDITALVVVIEQYVSTEEQTEERVDTPAREMQSNINLEDNAIRVEDGHVNSETDVWMETPQTSEKVDLTNMLRYKFLLFDSLGYILLLLSLVTAKVFLYRMKDALRSPNAEIRVGHASVPNKMVDDPKLVNMEYNFQEIPSRSWHTEVETMGEACPSKMSSFQKCSSYNNLSSRLNETQSNEKRPKRSYRRESLASSDYSMGSPSYGSFTTYKKIPCKNGDGEKEEIVTPVRCSSRLRKKFTSPLPYIVQLAHYVNESPVIFWLRLALTDLLCDYIKFKRIRFKLFRVSYSDLNISSL